MKFRSPQLCFICIVCVLQVFVTSGVQAKTPVLQPSAKTYQPMANEFASAIVVDNASGKVLYSFKPTMTWPAASLTKLMSMLVFLDYAPGWSSTITLLAKDEVGGGRMQAKSGTRATVANLFYTSLMASTNNTTMALARATGMSQSTFAKRMNQKAAVLGLKSTKFVEPTGMSPNNKTTAVDMAKLARKAFADAWIHRALTTPTYSFTMRGATTGIKSVKNTDTFLTAYDNVYVNGSKTGFLYESQYNLVTTLRGDAGSVVEPYITVVVFGAPTKAASFDSTSALAEWAWKAYSWQSAMPSKTLSAK